MSDNKTDLYSMFKGAEPPALSYTRADVENELEPVAGDRIIGTLGGNLPDTFVELTILEMELEDIAQDLRARAVKHVSNIILDGETDSAKLMQEATTHGLFHSEEEAAELFEKQALYYKMHSDFWYNVRTLFDCWNDWLSIRHDFHIVSVGKKFTKST
jgi:hypothetical protein